MSSLWDPASVCVERQPTPDGVPVVALCGEIDHNESAEVRSVLCAYGVVHGAVVADLSSVTFFDTSACHALFDAHRDLVSRGARMTIRRPTPLVGRMLSIVGLDRVLNVESEADPRSDSVW